MGRVWALAAAGWLVSCHAGPSVFEGLDGPRAGDAAPGAEASDDTGPAGPAAAVEAHGFSWQPFVTGWPAFALDGLSRLAVYQGKGTGKGKGQGTGKGNGRLVCPEVELVGYRGEALRYHKALRVNPAFREVLGRFEAVAREVAIEVYGRAPSRVVHYGTYNCRTVRRRGFKLSEHAFGNAIDVAGFEFAAAPRARQKALGRLGRAFRVDVEKHWHGTEGIDATHARFLKRLVIELRRDRVFRGMIVPPSPGHHNHLHLDMGRWAFLRGDVRLPPPERAVGFEGPRS